ncbi:uncharacterized protein LOC134542493 [Bacillus rossius redtenbacheri]|uniref:uncharacterized protein LOC134542493 n=1 Tax=Bacillus rossius redtenbacheri TaxID=93214 RepID=UPI002FDE495E
MGQYPCSTHGYNWEYEEQDEWDDDDTAAYTEGPEVIQMLLLLQHTTQPTPPLPASRTTETSVRNPSPPPVNEEAADGVWCPITDELVVQSWTGALPRMQTPPPRTTGSQSYATIGAKPPPPYGVETPGGETSPQTEEVLPVQPLWYNWHAWTGWTRKAGPDTPPPTPPPIAAQAVTEPRETNNNTELHSKGGGYVNWEELTRSADTPPTPAPVLAMPPPMPPPPYGMKTPSGKTSPQEITRRNCSSGTAHSCWEGCWHSVPAQNDALRHSLGDQPPSEPIMVDPTPPLHVMRTAEDTTPPPHVKRY